MGKRDEEKLWVLAIAIFAIFIFKLIAGGESVDYGINIVESTQQKMLDNNTGSDELIRLNKECLTRIDRLNSQIGYLTKTEDETISNNGNFDWGLLLLVGVICALIGYGYGKNSELSIDNKNK